MNIIVAYIHSFGVAALLAVVYGLSLRSNTNPLAMKLSLGLLFGAAAAIAMHDPITVTDGVFVDPRNLFISLAAAFLGPLSALVTVAVAAYARFQLGGVGVLAGLISMAISAAVGLAWRYAMRGRRTGVRSFCVLGAMISLFLLGTLALPREAMVDLLVNSGPYIVVFNLAGAAMFGALFERERKTANNVGKLKQEATTDPLTGLLNRRGFDRSFEQITSRTDVSQSALLLVDLDHFKRINDLHGHHGGDAVLEAVARVLQDSVRSTDVVSRFGGEEFVIYLPNTTQAEARHASERLRLAVSAVSPSVEGKRVCITASVGAVWKADQLDLAEAFREADHALYRAKELGRNMSILYDKDLVAA